MRNSAPKPLHIRTPLLESSTLSRLCGKQVFLKMDNLQPVGSFKIRGIGRVCQRGKDRGCAHFVCSSGGNAGYAAAYAGRMLGVPTTVFVPQTTSGEFRRLIALEGADVRVAGRVWDETHEQAVAFARSLGALYVHPFDDPEVWQGHSTLVDEVVEEIGAPEEIVLAVGGGGLLCGIIEGLKRHRLEATRIRAVETEGTASLAAALRAGHLVTLPEVNGIAKTLGARTVAPQAFEWAKQLAASPVVVSDAAAVEACARFADDHRALVEPSCGAALAAVYGGLIPPSNSGRLLIVVCGGLGISLKSLAEWSAS
jgi:L-serine/L-threonine ammonia-lyase